METWEKFCKRYPRLKLDSYLRRHNITTIASAMEHFENKGVVVPKDLLMAALNIPLVPVQHNTTLTPRKEEEDNNAPEVTNDLSDIATIRRKKKAVQEENVD